MSTGKPDEPVLTPLLTRLTLQPQVNRVKSEIFRVH